ncbi:MAG: S-layer homology domain-containing protein [Clostridia bacterium]
MKSSFFKQVLIISLISVLMLTQSPFSPLQAAGNAVAPSNFAGTILGTGYLRLTWDAVPNARFYAIKTVIDGQTISFLPAANKTSFLVPLTLEPGKTYTFSIMADFSTYSFSDFSAPISITKPINFFQFFQVSPASPSLLTSTTQADGSINLSWNDNATNEVGYYLYDYDGKLTTISELPANTTLKNISWLDDTLTSQLKICAIGTSNISAWSELTIEHPHCNTPSNLVAVKDSLGRVTLTWTDTSNNEKGFQVNTSDNDWFLAPVTLAAGITTYIDTRPKVAGYTYKYKVNSISPYVYYNHNYSNEVSVYFATAFTGVPTTTPAAIPKMPSNVAAIQKSDGSISVTWQDNSNDETSFQVLISEGSSGGSYDVPANTNIYLDKDQHTVGTTYTYTVRAMNSVGSSPWVAEKASIVYKANAVIPIITPGGINIGGLLFDGTQSKWAEPELSTAYTNTLTYNDIMNNYTQKINREEFCTIVVKLYEKLSGLQAGVTSNPFTDATNPEILKAYKLGIVNGTSTTTFSPNANITRQEVCVMILRCLNLALPSLNSATSGSLPFSDTSKINTWAKAAMLFCYENSIIKGSGSTISPLDNTTREQGISLLLRTFEKYKN